MFKSTKCVQGVISALGGLLVERSVVVVPLFTVLVFSRVKKRPLRVHVDIG